MPHVNVPPTFFEGREKELLRKLSLTVRDLLDGKSNNHADVTLDADSESTVIEHQRATIDTTIMLSAKTPSAAKAVAAGVVYYEVTVGKVTIFHDSQPDKDRTFGAIYVG